MPIVAQLQKQIATPTEKVIKKTPQITWKEPKKPRKQGAK